MTFDEENVKLGFLMGKQVYLRALEKEDLIYIRKWSNDPEIRKLTGEVTSMSHVDADKFLERVYNDNTREWFVIVIKENDRVIGEAGLLRMFPVWRTTDISIIIGEKYAWGKGYGTEAILLLLDYAFRYLNFHRVAIGVVAFNEKAIHFWEKIGFKKEMDIIITTSIMILL
ncbi:MAG: Spermidine N(1)-acetyltransferase [candidate division WS2 bacterium]|uniref:Spermidine N(1)-acetyltransferase n=1 Tax=Psychracetigena formicireducens TaxID=2986056 RepID=A0A9E2BIC7_PSYF1|nr:Spermidine N(1)-acetyltransferase [Candidatus Psychracetigena formicireducens]